ncbi:L,D-transpeptidase [Sphingobacterium prati]|uniref:L,D-transpeptidase n=1 Tax=Sphingobacterium prati TaxID=2737006 RepID=UPI00155755F8|nr:L,D-transpeptidase [Sphingobacterium prati]NPE46709.1 L,D-transpeptidase [Sphingobacterium prati]
MKYINTYLFGILLAALILTGCRDRNAKTQSASDREADLTEQAENTDFTLAWLNALFYEEDFERTLKSDLQLNKEQVTALKAAASAAVGELSEDEEASTKSFKASIKQATTEIVRILGEQKAGQFFHFIAARYADEQNKLPLQPNQVPEDTRIVVNAPAFRMDVFQQGKLIKTYKIGVGYPEFPLPTGVRKATNVIFNPTWTPPDEPWVKGKVTPGEKVPAGSKLNPLGPIKIPIGMPSLIHGGKDASKLGAFASHGCVGLTDAQVQDFTKVLTQVAGSPISAEEIADYEKKNTKTESVKLKQPVLVELRYETIVAQDGQLHIYRDVYERGTNTIENATRVLDAYGVKFEKLSEQEKSNLTQALNEMNQDARGNKIAGADHPDQGPAEDSAQKREAAKENRKEKGQVTRKVLGQQDIAVPIAALKDKGYPAPIAYNTGN